MDEKQLPIYITRSYDLAKVENKFKIKYVKINLDSFNEKYLLDEEELTCKIVNPYQNVEMTFLCGYLHSFDDKPAIVWNENNIKGWFKDGIPHRTTGPAAIYENGLKEWWLWGIKMEESALFLYNLDKNYESFLKKRYSCIKET